MKVLTNDDQGEHLSNLEKPLDDALNSLQVMDFEARNVMNGGYLCN